MDPDRLERLMLQVLDETRSLRHETNEFRQETNERFSRVERDLSGLKVEMGQVKDAIRTHSKELQRIETKLDTALAAHGARLDRLEQGAAE